MPTPHTKRAVIMTTYFLREVGMAYGRYATLLFTTQSITLFYHLYLPSQDHGLNAYHFYY